MRPTATIYAVEGSLGGEQIVMGIDPGAMDHILQVLTDLYSDPIKALLREYSTNAWDSHVEAGVTKPIRIDLPGILSPYLVVRDFGIGMGPEDIRNVYSRYGTSTKHDTDEQTGRLGLGGKSALTYTNQFSVTAVKDGVKTFVAVQRVGDGKIIMEIIDTMPTTESNGVEVKIPVRNSDFDKFGDAAKHFFSFWDAGTVVINDAPHNPPTPGLRIDDRTYVRFDLDQDYVVMGNVAYPIDARLVNSYSWRRNFGVVTHVKMGSNEAINFTPNREEVNWDDRSNKALGVIQQRVKGGLTKALNDSIANAETYTAAFDAAARLRSMFGNQQNFTYRGLVVPRSLTLQGRRWDRQAGRYSVQTGQVDFSSIEKVFFVKGFDAETFSPGHKKKINLYMKQEGIDNRYVAIVRDIPTSNFFDAVKWTDWSVIKPMREARVAGANRAFVEKIPLIVWKDGVHSKVDYSELPKTGTVAFMSPTEYKGRMTELTAAMPDVTLVVLGRNRWDRLQRLMPNAKHIGTVLDEQWNAFDASLTKDQKERIGTREWDIRPWTAFKPGDFDDPALNSTVIWANTAVDSKVRARYDAFHGVLPYFKRFSPRALPNLRNYPLLSGRMDTHPSHSITYANAVYNANKEKE